MKSSNKQENSSRSSLSSLLTAQKTQNQDESTPQENEGGDYNEALERLVQLADVIESNNQLCCKILRERAILALEDTLMIEFKQYKEIFAKLDEFADYARNLQEYLNGSVKKVYIEGQISIDIDILNTFLAESTELIEKILSKHSDFFIEYGDVQNQLYEIIQQTYGQIRIISQIKESIKQKSQEVKHLQDTQTQREYQKYCKAELEKYNDNPKIDQQQPLTKQHEAEEGSLERKEDKSQSLE